MVRKLKYHEQKLLKKVDFVSWKADSNIREIQILRKYHIQKRDDYTKLEIIDNLCTTIYEYMYTAFSPKQVQQTCWNDQVAG